MTQRFDHDVQRAVNAAAPRLFAVVHQPDDSSCGERIEGRILAWGMAFPDGADIVGRGGFRMSVQDPELALERITALDAGLVWVRPHLRSHDETSS